MYLMRLLLLAFFVCGCNGPFGGKMKIGVDPYWYPIDFGKQTSYVNGYTEELLLEMSRYSGMEFELIQANWDTLFDGLKREKYDAVLTSLPPYEYNLAKYEFSENYLDFGPVLIVSVDSNVKELDKMERGMVGVIENDPAVLLLEKHPKLIVRTYSSIPSLLNAVAAGEIQGGLLEKIPAVNYIADLYSEKLHIADGVLSNTGLHLVAKKGSDIRAFNKTLKALRRKKVLERLQKKWDLQ
jgi:ABC-type amino acid transport substrate-binding protein